eukprot:1135654-Rhodomonas_salina.2
MSQGVSHAESSQGVSGASSYAGAVCGGKCLTAFGSALRCLSECMLLLQAESRLQQSTNSFGNITRRTAVREACSYHAPTWHDPAMTLANQWDWRKQVTFNVTPLQYMHMEQMQAVLGLCSHAAVFHWVSNGSILAQAGLLNTVHQYEVQLSSSMGILDDMSAVVEEFFLNWSQIIHNEGVHGTGKWAGVASNRLTNIFLSQEISRQLALSKPLLHVMLSLLQSIHCVNDNALALAAQVGTRCYWHSVFKDSDITCSLCTPVIMRQAATGKEPALKKKFAAWKKKLPC